MQALARLARLVEALEASPSTAEQALHLRRYLAQVPAGDARRALPLLVGHPSGVRLSPALLRDSALAASGLSPWLFDASRRAAGSLADAIAHVVPSAATEEVADGSLEAWLTDRLPGLAGLPREARVATLQQWWPALDAPGRWLLARLLGGGLAAVLTPQALAQALAEIAGIGPVPMMQRLTVFLADPGPERFAALMAPEGMPHGGLPDPFPPLTQTRTVPVGPTEAADWHATWLPDGLRVQLVRHRDGTALWSEAGDRHDDRFAELIDAASTLPEGTVLDGWVVAATPRSPWTALAARLAGRTPSRAAQARQPVRFVAVDLPGTAGHDLRTQPLAVRLATLQPLLAVARDRLSAAPRLPFDDLAALHRHHAGCRAHGARGLLLRHGAGLRALNRETDRWWHWPAAPLTVRAVLVYAQIGPRGFDHYSFALWDGPPQATPEPRLVTVAKVPAASTGDLADELAAVVQATSTARIGPVREVQPTRVYQLAFDAVARSPRHKSGFTLQAVRAVRACPETALREADCLQALGALLDAVDG